MIYFHRFYRLAPNVFLLIFFAMTFYAYLGSGPVWFEQREKWIKDCPTTFWAYITFINSIYPGDANGCVGWLWYLSHDMLFFLFLPFQVLLYYRARKISYIIAYTLLAGNLILVAWLTIHFNVGTSILTNPVEGRKLYFKPWARFGSYQVGMIFGYMYYEYVKGNTPEGKKSTIGYKFFKSVQISKGLRWFFYVLGIGIMLVMVFIVTPDNRRFLRGRYWGNTFAAIYSSLCRPLYVTGLALVLMGPIVGKNEFLQIFLGSRFWAPWAKVAFYSYMVHLFVFTWYFGQMRQSFFLNHKGILWSYFGVIFISIFVATFFSVLFEAPWMQLEKLVLFPPRKKKKVEKLEEEPSLEVMKYNTGLQDKLDDTEVSDTYDTYVDEQSNLKKRAKDSF